MVRRCGVNFQCRGVLPTWITVEQGPIVLAVGAGGGCLDIFSLIYHFSFLSPSLWETARYRLKYCLKGPLSPNQPTNQPFMFAQFSSPEPKAALGSFIVWEYAKALLVGCFEFKGPLRQYFSLYRAVSQRQGERGAKALLSIIFVCGEFFKISYAAFLMCIYNLRKHLH